MSDLYRFPESRFTTNTRKAQFDHIVTEVAEVYSGMTNEERDFDIASEVWDVIHSCETLLRLMQAQGVDVSAARMYVEGKNRARGYYGDQA